MKRTKREINHGFTRMNTDRKLILLKKSGFIRG